MKTFIGSYIISVGFLIYIWWPDVLARPFHIIPRLVFYFGFPMSVFLTFLLIMLVNYTGLIGKGRDYGDLSKHKPARNGNLNRETKSA